MRYYRLSVSCRYHNNYILPKVKCLEALDLFGFQVNFAITALVIAKCRLLRNMAVGLSVEIGSLVLELTKIISTKNGQSEGSFPQSEFFSWRHVTSANQGLSLSLSLSLAPGGKKRDPG